MFTEFSAIHMWSMHFSFRQAFVARARARCGFAARVTFPETAHHRPAVDVRAASSPRFCPFAR